MLACTAVSIKGSKNSISRGCQFTPHTDLTEKEKYLVGGRVGGGDAGLYRGRGIHAPCLFFHLDKSTAATLLLPHLRLSTALPAASPPAPHSSFLLPALPCLALLPCLLARESRQALITQASQQFISTGEPTANWKTCTLATIYNESYPVLLSPRLGSINAT